MHTVSAEYLLGINEGRERFEQYGLAIATDELENLRMTIKGFGASTPVGQMLRGERDFWINQIKRAS